MTCFKIFHSGTGDPKDEKSRGSTSRNTGQDQRSFLGTPRIIMQNFAKMQRLYTACTASLPLLEMWWRVLSAPEETSGWWAGCQWGGLSWALELMLKGSCEPSLYYCWVVSVAGHCSVHFLNHTGIILASASDSYDDNLNLGELCSFSAQCISQYFLGNYYSTLHFLEKFVKSKLCLNLLVCLGNVYKER